MSCLPPFLFAVLFSSNIGIVQLLPIGSRCGEAVGRWECTQRCVHKWALLYGMKLIWFCTLVQEYDGGLERLLGRFGHFLLTLPHSSRIALPSMAVFVLWDQRKIQFLSHPAWRLPNQGWNKLSSLYSGYTTLNGTEEYFKAYFSKATLFYLQQNTYPESSHAENFMPVLSAITSTGCRGSVFVSAVAADQSPFALVLAIKMYVMEWRIPLLHSNVILHVLPPVSHQSSSSSSLLDLTSPPDIPHIKGFWFLRVCPCSHLHSICL